MQGSYLRVMVEAGGVELYRGCKIQYFPVKLITYSIL